MSRDISKYIVFQKSHDLVLNIYKTTHRFPNDEKYGLSSQMRRSAASIPMNLAEGAARAGEAEFRHFVNIARGSLAELKYQLMLARDLGYIEKEIMNDLVGKADEIGKMLTVLFQKLKA